jgi:hypothetical protein
MEGGQHRNRKSMEWKDREGFESGGGGRACKGRRTEQRMHGIEGGQEGLENKDREGLHRMYSMLIGQGCREEI